jgi:Na+/H+ antiporter NhaC
MQGEEMKKVMKWIGYVYIPIIVIFAAVYLFVQYRLHKIESSRLPDQQAATASSSSQ